MTHIAKFMGPTWGPPGSCRPQMGPILDPWNLLSGELSSIFALLPLYFTMNRRSKLPVRVRKGLPGHQFAATANIHNTFSKQDVMPAGDIIQLLYNEISIFNVKMYVSHLDSRVYQWFKKQIDNIIPFSDVCFQAPFNTVRTSILNYS